jgi:hypothetical protein
MSTNYWTNDRGDAAYALVTSYQDRLGLARNSTFMQTVAFCDREDWVDNPLPKTKWEREQESLMPNVSQMSTRTVTIVNVPDEGATIAKRIRDEMAWHAQLIEKMGPSEEVEGEYEVIDPEDWDDVCAYEAQPTTLVAPPCPAIEVEDESQTHYHAKVARKMGEQPAQVLLENKDVEINRKLPVWKQRLVSVDPDRTEYIEQASGEVMPYIKTYPPQQTTKPSSAVLPPCEISILGEIREMDQGFCPLNILRVAQRKGPAHLIFSRPEDVNAALQTVYRPYVAVRFGALSMPRATLAYWWHGSMRSVVAVYWSDTDQPSQAILKSIEFVDASPLSAVRVFTPFFLEKLHPKTIIKLIRQAYYGGKLYSVDTEGDPVSPRDACILRAAPGQRPIQMQYDRIGPHVLFIAKGAHAEYRFLESRGRSVLLDAQGHGLLDIAPYVRWEREQRKHHRAVDGASQTLSRALELAIGIPSVYYGGFSKEKTDLFLRTSLPPALKRLVRTTVHHHQIRGEAPPITKTIRTAGMRFQESSFIGFVNDNQCDSIHASIRSKREDINAIVDTMASFSSKSQAELDVLEQYPIKLLGDRPG